MRVWTSTEDEGIPPAPPDLGAVPGAREVLQIVEADHRLTERQKVEAVRLAWNALFGESQPHHPLWPVAHLLIEAVQGLPRDGAVSALSAAFQHVAARAPAEVLR
jgi:hypothetical protein